jgi:energy-coupling factor transporter ATP-binding protein EcfA2
MTTVAIPTGVQEVSYDQFLRVFRYSQDQHVTICGPTGCGKSVLITDLLIPRQPYPVFFSTKPRDATIDDSDMFGKDWGWTSDPDEIHPDIHSKWVVGLSNFGDPDDVKERHRELFGRTLRKCYAASGWAMDIDEGRYVCDPKYLGLHAIVAQYYFHGRSDFKSMTLATQRPSWVPLEAFDMATHLFFFNDDDERNVDTMAGAAGANRKLFLDVIPHLDTTEHEGGQFLYYNRSTKVKLISKVEL